MWNNCIGSGESPTCDIWRDSKFINNKYNNKGYRTICHFCGKEIAIGPASGVIVIHTPNPITSTEKKQLSNLYDLIYNAGLKGVSIRPDPAIVAIPSLIKIWKMAYLDGLADGRYNKKAGAFKRWLTKEKL